MKKLLGLAAITLTLALSATADPIEVIIQGQIEDVVSATGLDLSTYIGKSVEYSFIFDIAEDGTFYSLYSNSTINYNTLGLNAFYAELSSDLYINIPATLNPTDTDFHYGYVSGGRTDMRMGATNTRSLQLSFDQSYKEWAASENGNPGTSSIEIKEWYNNGYLHSMNFEILSIGSPATSSVPEPSTVIMLLSGISLLGLASRRKR